MISVAIAAAGNSTRFGGNKMLSLIKGEPVLVRTITQFSRSKNVEEIVIAAREEEIETYKKLMAKAKLKAKIVKGGPERIISAYNAAKATKGDFIITHDGNRPLTPVWLIDKLIEETKKYGAVIPAISPTATIKYVENFLIKESFLREKTLIAQTPQGFRRELILKAYKKAIKEKYFIPTDDSELVTRLGVKVKIILGDLVNIKITTPLDLVIAEQLFESLDKNV